MFEFEESKKDLKNDLMIECSVIAVYAIIWIYIGFMALTQLKALDDPINFTKWGVFGMLIAPYVILLFIIKFAQYNNYLKFLYLPAHDPEKGVTGDISFFKNPLKLFIIFYFVIIILGLVSSLVPQSALTNFVYPLQSTVGASMQSSLPSGRIAFAVYNSIAENFYLYLILGILVSTEFAIAKFIIKVKSLKPVFIIMLIPNAFLGAVAWVKMHALVSGSSMPAQLSHFIFGIELSSLVLLTGSIIPSELLHFGNNFFIQLRLEYGTSIMPFIFGGLLLLGVFAIGLYILIKRRIKK